MQVFNILIISLQDHSNAPLSASSVVIVSPIGAFIDLMIVRVGRGAWHLLRNPRSVHVRQLPFNRRILMNKCLSSYSMVMIGIPRLFTRGYKGVGTLRCAVRRTSSETGSAQRRSMEEQNTVAEIHDTEKSRLSKQETMFVSEVFTSVQGEGPFCGRPSVFLRLGLCNLECAWCDTKYTWLYRDEQRDSIRKRVMEFEDVGRAQQAEWLGEWHRTYDKPNELKRISVEKVKTQVMERVRSSGARAVVITGGEPLLHAKHLRDLVPFLVEQHGLDVEIETNGTLFPFGIEAWCSKNGIGVHFNVSPKLANSVQSETRRLVPDVLAYFSRQLEHASVFKFVVNSEADLDQAHALVQAYDVDRQRVWLMPEGTEAEHLAKAAYERVIPWCIQYGYRYSHRLHVAIWGNRRGV